MRPTSVGGTVRVKVAGVVCPGWSIVPSWFHVIVIVPFAVVGLQLDVVMFRVSATPLLLFFDVDCLRGGSAGG